MTNELFKIWEFGEIIELLKKDALPFLLVTAQSLELY